MAIWTDGAVRPRTQASPIGGRGRTQVVERCIHKLKHLRAVAIRYDKREYMYQRTVDIASIGIWLRDPVP